jgi:ribosomal protein S27AE
MAMKNLRQSQTCPRCGALKMKKWDELSDEQRFLVERLPLNTDFTIEQRKKHRFCERCWFEEIRELNNLS